MNKLDLINTPVTLNGKKACIAGRKNEFATVFTFDGLLRAEFSWEVVQRVVLRGGKFFV